VTGVDDLFDQEATFSYRDLPDRLATVGDLRDKAQGRYPRRVHAALPSLLLQCQHEWPPSAGLVTESDL
jgi:hypothetical protein